MDNLSSEHASLCGMDRPPNRTETDYNGQSGLQRKSSGASLPSIQDLNVSRVRERAGNISADPPHPEHNLFLLLPSGRCYRALYTKTTRHENGFLKFFLTWFEGLRTEGVTTVQIVKPSEANDLEQPILSLEQDAEEQLSNQEIELEMGEECLLAVGTPAEGRRSQGPHPGARPGVGARRRAPGGRVFAHGTRPGSARNGDVGPPSSRLTTRRKVHEGPVQCGLGSSRGRGPRRPNPWNKTLAIGTWNVTSLGGRSLSFQVREVERYRLEIVGLTSTHSLGSGTQLLERGWTLHYSGVAQGERRRAGVGLLIAPQLSRHVLEFTPVNERVASLRLRVGDRSLAIVCAYGPNSEQQYRVPGLLGVPGRGT
ncbi:hypothetical protein L3Q82_009118 [Scortum barcoo]|uniref:Uncharacterized protein n=1 Tax=Scortum barcoo TaxID=214431 RepID=A0ACB8XA44_9TELE|nr:hypothetical protein L3Q82_009118 [Scortum barcoo]